MQSGSPKWLQHIIKRNKYMNTRSWDILLKANIKLVMVLNEKSEDHQSQWDLSSETMNCRCRRCWTNIFHASSMLKNALRCSFHTIRQNLQKHKFPNALWLSPQILQTSPTCLKLSKRSKTDGFFSNHYRCLMKKNDNPKHEMPTPKISGLFTGLWSLLSITLQILVLVSLQIITADIFFSESEQTTHNKFLVVVKTELTHFQTTRCKSLIN